MGSFPKYPTVFYEIRRAVGVTPTALLVCQKAAIRMEHESRKAIVCVVCLCLIVALLTLCLTTVSTAASGEPKSIKVGAAMPISGRFASGGHTVKLGYEIAVDSVNQAGGIYVKELIR